jgi:hypothetical protein
MSKKWNMEIAWERQSNYKLRCVEETFGLSSKDSPMITLKFEVVSPEEMEVAGEVYNIAGTPLRYFQVTKSMADGQVDVDKTAECKKRLEKLYAAFDLPTDNINPENPTLGFKGKVVYAMLENSVTEKRKSPTKEQLAKGVKQGDILLNPKTNQPLTSNYPKISEIFGTASVDASKPY